MIRKLLFFLHLSAGVAAGAFIFVMAATGVMLCFERQIIDFVDRDIRSVTIPADSQPRRIADLFDAVHRAGLGEPTAIVVRNDSQAAIQLSLGRGKTVYVDPYSGAVLGGSSAAAHEFFFAVERLHRAFGAPLGSKGVGRWLAGVSNLIFGVLILLGVAIWTPRKWTWRAIRASAGFRTGLRGRAREWNWHNVLGIWSAIPLLVIVLTGVVMSFDWANALLFRLSGSAVPTAAVRDGDYPHGQGRSGEIGRESAYDQLLTMSKALNLDWRTISINIARDGSGPVSVGIDTSAGGQPQKRTQYCLDRETGAVLKTTTFGDGSLGQRLRAFVRFGHTGEYGGWVGQVIAGLASLSACVLVYTGLALAARRLRTKLKRKQRDHLASTETYEAQLIS